jgi:hypothetical protein
MIQASLRAPRDADANQKGFWGMLEEIGSSLHESAGGTQDALLTTIVAFLVNHSAEAQPQERAMAVDIIQLLAVRASPVALADARQKLEASGFAFPALNLSPEGAQAPAQPMVAPDHGSCPRQRSLPRFWQHVPVGCRHS